MKLSGNIWEVKNIDRDKELEHFKGQNVLLLLSVYMYSQYLNTMSILALREEENVAIPKEKRRLLHPKKKQQVHLWAFMLY